MLRQFPSTTILDALTTVPAMLCWLYVVACEHVLCLVVFRCIELRVCIHLCGHFTLKAFTRMQHKVFPLKFDAKPCEVILNSRMKPRTGPCQVRLPWTRPWGATPRPALPNRHVGPVLLCDITQHKVVIRYWCFRTTCWPCLQRSKFQTREHSMTEVNWHFFFWGGGFVHCLIF